MKKFTLLTALFIAASFHIANAQYSKLFDFTGAVSGSNPYGNLISDGTFLYGTTSAGGSSGLGTIYKIMPDGTGYVKLFDFTGAATGSNPFGYLVTDGTFLYGMTHIGGTGAGGTIYKIMPDGTGFSVLFNFTYGGLTGSQCLGSLIYDGTYLYGMTHGGGTSTMGVVFKILPNGTGFTKLLDFTGANGQFPYYNTLVSAGGALYGMTVNGGTSGLGIIFKIMPDGTGYTKLLDFTGTTNGSNPYYGSLVFDGTFLYGMTRNGGTSGLGTLFKIMPNGTGYTKLLDFAGAANGSNPFGGLRYDGTFLYGMTSAGGTSGLGTLFKIMPNGTSFAKLFDFTGTVNGNGPSGALFSDGTFLYGTTTAGGTSNLGTVFKFTQGNNIVTGAVTSPHCAGAVISVPYTANGTFNAGNIFTAELSDASGSFAAPVSIGTLASTLSGIISAVIPGSTIAGSGYRIRVVSSNPVITGSDNGSNIAINVFTVPGTVFTESTGSVGATTTIAAHETANGFDNDPYTMTGTGDIRNTSPSTGYAGASGLANVFITNVAGRDYQIAGINTIGSTGLQLSFGIFKSTTAGTGSDLIVEASSDGTTFTPLSYTALPTGTGTAIWHYRTATGTIPATANLRIRFRQTGVTTQYRIDDVMLAGNIPGTASIIAGGATTFCSGGSVTLTASSAVSWLWSNSATTQSISVSTAGTYTVTVSNGICNATSAPVIVTVNTTPVIGSCPSDIVQCDNHVATWTDPTATGTPAASVSCSPASGSTFATGTTSVTCTATNLCGSSSCSFNVTINETPVLTCPADIIDATTNPSGKVETYAVPTGGSPTATAVCNPPSGSTFPIGNTVVTCNATNSCGTGSCNFNVNISLTCIPPVIGACPSNIIQCNNHVATWTDPTATGTSPTIVCSPTSGSTFASGTTTVTCTATNACGSSSCAFDVTINESPVIGACPADISTCNPVVTYSMPSATGTPAATVSCSPVSGSIFSAGTTSVTCTATNSCGSSSCSFNVTVNTAPTITCPANMISFPASGSCGGPVDLIASATGTPAPTITYSPASGSFFPVGTTTVTATATNICGSSTCTFTVTVTDNQPPNAVCQNITVQLSAAGTASISPAQVNNGSTDNCGTVNLVSVVPATFNCSNVGTAMANDLIISEYVEGSSNNKYMEIFNGTNTAKNLANYELRLYANGSATATTTNNLGAAGALAPGATVVFRNSAAVIYGGTSFVFSAVNWNGDDAIALFNTVTVLNADIFGRIGDDPGSSWSLGGNSTVDKTLRRKSTVVNGVTVSPTGTGPGAFITLFSEWDQFSIDVVTGLGAHTYSPPPTTTPVTLTINDGNGNTSTCIANVTVQDITPPTAVCQNITVQLGAAGTVSITAAQVNNGSSDSCGIASMSVSPGSFTCVNLGANTVTLTVTDVNGLTSTCTSTVTVQDVTPPVANCQNISINLDNTGNATITPAQVNNNSTDNCGIASMSVLPNTFNCSNVTPVSGPSSAWINEFHYDNTGTDAGEFIEIAGNAGLNLTGWSIVLYNGADGMSYSTTPLSGTLSNQSNGFGFMAVNYAVNGIQNGAPDAIALVNNLSTVVQFLSYEGTMTALNGPANGQTSTDIGVMQNGSGATGNSLRLIGTGTSYASFTWAPEAPATSGAVNTGQTFVAPSGNTVTLTVTDATGNSSSCTATVTVNDVTLPTVVCQNISVPLGSSGSVTITASQVNNGSSDACGILSSSVVPNTFNCTDIGPNTVTLTVIDVNGNSASCNATVTIQDNTPPLANCQNATVQLDAFGNATITAAQINNGSSDACGILTSSVSPSSFNCSDVAGDPVADLIISEYVEGTSNNKYLEIYNGTGAAINLGNYQLRNYSNGSPTPTFNNTLSGTLAAGATAVYRNSAAVTYGGPSTAISSVVFNGDDAVVLFKISTSSFVDIIGRIGEDPGTSWTAPGGYTTENATLRRKSFVIQGVSSNPSSGFPTLSSEWDIFPVDNVANLGAHSLNAGNLVTLTVTDIYSNVSTCTAYVTVQDLIQPVISCPFSGTVTRNTNAGVCTYTVQAAEFNATATDNCTVTSLTYLLIGATTGTGTNLANVVFNKGSTIVSWTASDGINPTVQCSFLVTVLDNQFPVFTTPCPASFAACNAPGISWTPPVASDNCSVILSSNFAPGHYFTPGTTTTVTYSAEDPSGNITTCSFDVTAKTESTDPTSASASPTIVCAGDQVSLSVTGGSLGTGAVWKWYAGGCGGTLVGIGASINVNINSTTTYFVRAEGDCNTTNCVSITVTVRTLSTDPASISTSATLICIGGSATLNVVGGSLGTGAVWEWHEDLCGSTVIGTGPSIVVSPASSGVHNYYVRAVGPCNTTNCAGVSIGVAINSVEATSATTNVVANSICTGNTITLNVLGGLLGTGADWKWYAGGCGSGASVGTGASITITPAGTTTYYVRAEGLCNTTICVSVTVIVSTSAPTNHANIIQSPQSICSGSQGTFTCQTVSNATYYSWSAPNGTTFNGNNPSPYITFVPTVQVTFGPLPPGLTGYDICVFAGNGCGTSVTKCKYVRGRVVTPQIITGNASPCPNTSGVYTVQSTPGADSYTWTVTGDANINGAGTTVTTNGTSVTLNFGPAWVSGTLSVTANMNCGYSSPPRVINIVSTPPMPGAISGSAVVCPLQSSVFSIAPVAGATGYIWTTSVAGSTITPSGTSASILFGSAIPAGSTVSVVAVGNCGNSAPRNKNIGTGVANAPGTITGLTIGQCVETGQSYSILPVNGATSYLWTTTAGASVSGPNNLSAVTIDFLGGFSTVTLSVIAVNSCGNSAPQNLVITGAPAQPAVIGGAQAVCFESVWDYTTAGSYGATYYNWASPAGSTIILGQGTGTATVMWGMTSGDVTVNAENACGTSIDRILPVSVVCRQGQVMTSSEASLYPNPTEGYTTIRFESASSGTFQISVVDAMGRTIQSQAVHATEGTNMHELDLTTYAKGLYMVRMERSGEPVQTLKVTLE